MQAAASRRLPLAPAAAAAALGHRDLVCASRSHHPPPLAPPAAGRAANAPEPAAGAANGVAMVHALLRQLGAQLGRKSSTRRALRGCDAANGRAALASPSAPPGWQHQHQQHQHQQPPRPAAAGVDLGDATPTGSGGWRRPLGAVQGCRGCRGCRGCGLGIDAPHAAPRPHGRQPGAVSRLADPLAASGGRARVGLRRGSGQIAPGPAWFTPHGARGRPRALHWTPQRRRPRRGPAGARARG